MAAEALDLMAVLQVAGAPKSMAAASYLLDLQSLMVLVHQRTIDADDRFDSMDFVQPKDVQQPNRDVHLLNLF